MAEFFENVTKQKFNKKCFVASIFAGAFDSMHPEMDRATIYKYYCEISKNDFTDDIVVQGVKGNISVYSDHQELEQALFSAMLTSDPINNFPVIDLDEKPIGSSFNIVGIYDKIKKHKTKTKQEDMAYASIRTGDGIIDITIFPKQYQTYKKLIKKNLVCTFNIKKQGDDNFIVNHIEFAS